MFSLSRKKCCYIIAVLLLTPALLRPAIPNLDLIDSITAVTLPRASYDISLTAYANGSLLTKAILGLHDNIYLGASFDVEGLVGKWCHTSEYTRGDR